jgi:DNA-binding NtrC family response regulator
VSFNEKLKALIVDDEKCIGDFLVRFLKHQGLEAESVDGGSAAIAAAQKKNYDLVFLDVRMPNMNGVQALKELKKSNPQAAYIMMTGYAVDDLLEEAKKDGAVLMLQKPFELSPLVKFIKEIGSGRPDESPISILAVDDDKDILVFLKKLLVDYKVMTAASGHEACELIKKQRFDLVFLDIELGDMNGIELNAKISEISPGSNVVFITGFYEQYKSHLEKLEIKGCLSKPLNDLSQIMAEIDKVRLSKKR